MVMVMMVRHHDCSLLWCSWVVQWRLFYFEIVYHTVFIDCAADLRVAARGVFRSIVRTWPSQILRLSLLCSRWRSLWCSNATRQNFLLPRHHFFIDQLRWTYQLYMLFLIRWLTTMLSLKFLLLLLVVLRRCCVCETSTPLNNLRLLMLAIGWAAIKALRWVGCPSRRLNVEFCGMVRCGRKSFVHRH